MDVLNSSDNIAKDYFFILSPSKGYRGKQIKEAMQVMELWDNIITVKCDGGCMNKPYEYFERVKNLNDYKIIHRSNYFEDNRSKNKLINEK